MQIQTTGLRAVASDLGGAAQALTDISGDLTTVAAVGEPILQEGMEALTVAWGTALEVLAEDVSFMSAQVAAAADLYEATDRELGGVIVTPPR